VWWRPRPTPSPARSLRPSPASPPAMRPGLPTASTP